MFLQINLQQALLSWPWGISQSTFKIFDKSELFEFILYIILLIGNVLWSYNMVKRTLFHNAPAHTLLCAHFAHMGANAHNAREQAPATPARLGGPPQPRFSSPGPQSAPMGIFLSLGEACSGASVPEVLGCGFPACCCSAWLRSSASATCWARARSFPLAGLTAKV